MDNLENQYKPTPKRNRGGSRPNSGRKQKYGEETKTITFRVPKSKIYFIKETIKYILENELDNIN
jgi:hypothetical protein